MSRESVNAFMERMKTDEEFARQVISCQDKEERLQFVRAAGFDITVEDMAGLKDELTDEELEAIAGGKPGQCDECASVGLL